MNSPIASCLSPSNVDDVINAFRLTSFLKIALWNRIEWKTVDFRWNCVAYFSVGGCWRSQRLPNRYYKFDNVHFHFSNIIIQHIVRYLDNLAFFLTHRTNRPEKEMLEWTEWWLMRDNSIRDNSSVEVDVFGYVHLGIVTEQAEKMSTSEFPPRIAPFMEGRISRIIHSEHTKLTAILTQNIHSKSKGMNSKRKWFDRRLRF